MGDHYVKTAHLNLTAWALDAIGNVLVVRRSLKTHSDSYMSSCFTRMVYRIACKGIENLDFRRRDTLRALKIIH